MYEELVKRLREEGEYADLMAYMHGIRPINPEAAGIAKNWEELFAKAAEAIENTSKAYQMMAEAYEAEVTKPRWIPVTERLPETARDVLVAFWLPTKKIYLITITQRASWSEKQKHGAFYQRGVTHWMEMPEPPKGE